MLSPIHQVAMSALSVNVHRARAACCIPGDRPLRTSACRKQLTARQVLDRNRTSHCSNTPREHRQCRAEQTKLRLLLTLSYTAMQSPQTLAQVRACLRSSHQLILPLAPRGFALCSVAAAAAARRCGHMRCRCHASICAGPANLGRTSTLRLRTQRCSSLLPLVLDQVEVQELDITCSNCLRLSSFTKACWRTRTH